MTKAPSAPRATPPTPQSARQPAPATDDGAAGDAWRVCSPLLHDGQFYAPGDTLVLARGITAEMLLAAGVIEALADGAE